MKKLLSAFIGLIIIFSIIAYGGAGVSAAEAEPACGNGALEEDEECDDGNKADGDGCSSACKFENPIIKKCNKEIEFRKAIKTIELEGPYTLKNRPHYDLNFRLKFEEVRAKYHNFAKCVFDNATAEMLGSSAGETEGIFSAHGTGLPEWLKAITNPDKACISEEKLKEILESGGPDGLLQPMLSTYNQYVDYLDQLYAQIAKNPTVDDETRENFPLIVLRQNAFRLLVENEKQDAIVALDTAFQSLKELRQAFVMHVRFQCMLKYLEIYRRTLENLRSVMWVIPPLIEDASKS